MDRGIVTTPFGRRSMTLGMLACQLSSAPAVDDGSVDKWKLFRTICVAKASLGVSDRSLAVLNALLSFYPRTELDVANGLVVFPSNAQLSLRTHGMAETTLRRHLTALIDAGLILRRDSPNGKRYARRDRKGAIGQAFGFDLAPLLARAAEIEAEAARLEADRRYLQVMRERLSLCRRDVAKLVELLRQSDFVYADEAEMQCQAVYRALSRKPLIAEVVRALDILAALRDDLTNRLETLLKTQNTVGNERQNERHIQSSESDNLSESEAACEKAEAEFSRQLQDEERSRKHLLRSQLAEDPPTQNRQRLPPPAQNPLNALPVVLKACPQIRDYGPCGRIDTWRDLLSAAVVVKTMLGISPDAYDDACATLGPETTATVLACLLERSEHIHSAGGYLRDLTRRARGQSFTVSAMLSARLRAQAGGTAMSS
ncbi:MULTISPECIES: plasmid replication protein RepC [unclassified Ensifer]|uniref:plasmid replication protein RepC n=1 Tax=unclassified Ensifer TaxID=2633371 RepID=UPI0008135554|nr:MULTISPECIES: plasmid replication protein RepC [unclassified Ensifer]OCP00492.1 replication initiation protein RepC [Ensifer sp. LC14]OCP05862.1 replication initiation protein RepC [Ensifer sp. LC11]OCP06611.1 replication initiation protein RepC [Ensifer sp. LC13]OCP31149.1 replication initiation protein RepC [Ensifer sp. LC499]